MWNKNYASCVVCGGTSYKHIAKGICTSCYMKEYVKKNIDKARKCKHEWYLRNVSRADLKRRREERYFSSNREKVLLRDNYACVRCGNTETLVVHHIDNKGRSVSVTEQNNDSDNLMTLCRKCHLQEHLIIPRWAKYYNSCINCGTTTIQHRGKGLCIKCYSDHRSRELYGEKRRGVKWSLKYDNCKLCGTDSTKHKGHGLCENCYKKEQYKSKDIV